MFKRIDHVALHVADLDSSVAFYEKHFGFRNYFQAPIPGGMQIAYLKLGDTVLELTHHSDGAMKGFHFCLETDDFDGSVAKLKADWGPNFDFNHLKAMEGARRLGISREAVDIYLASDVIDRIGLYHRDRQRRLAVEGVVEHHLSRVRQREERADTRREFGRHHYRPIFEGMQFRRDIGSRALAPRRG